MLIKVKKMGEFRFDVNGLIERIDRTENGRMKVTRRQKFVLYHDILHYLSLVEDGTLIKPRSGYLYALEGFIDGNKKEAETYKQKIDRKVHTAIIDVARAFKVKPEEYMPLPSVEFLTVEVPEGTVDFDAAYHAEMKNRSSHGAIILTPDALGHLDVYAHEGGHFLRELFHPRKADGSDLLVSEFFGFAGEMVYGESLTGDAVTSYGSAFSAQYNQLKGTKLTKQQRVDISRAFALASTSSITEFNAVLKLYPDDLVRKPTEVVERELRYNSRMMGKMVNETFGD